MMGLESPSTITFVKPNSIHVSTTSRQTRASASKAVPTAVCRRDLKTRTSSFTFRATIPEADLKPWHLNKASKLILMFYPSGSYFCLTKSTTTKRCWDSVLFPNTQ
ncbi:uncharacterized protein [Gossypium hirsutum]|uniref:Uncharacterized protein n=1 Tax=Gossypium hirsutum TaxID=3635 RepID=A0A1U8M161_GOSHI|nr:uncharacterized protein LOC107932936 [Gossypium hirsutum]